MLMSEMRGLLQMEFARGSTIRANIKGERGQPFRVPLVIVTGSERMSEVRTLAEDKE